MSQKYVEYCNIYNKHELTLFRRKRLKCRRSV